MIRIQQATIRSISSMLKFHSMSSFATLFPEVEPTQHRPLSSSPIPIAGPAD